MISTGAAPERIEAFSGFVAWVLLLAAYVILAAGLYFQAL